MRLHHAKRETNPVVSSQPSSAASSITEVPATRIQAAPLHHPAAKRRSLLSPGRPHAGSWPPRPRHALIASVRLSTPSLR